MRLPVYCLCAMMVAMSVNAEEIESQVALQERLQEAEEKSDALVQVCLTLATQEEVYEEMVQEGNQLYTELKQEVEVLKATALTHEEWKEEIEETLSHCLARFEPVAQVQEVPLIEEIVQELSLTPEVDKCECCCCCEGDEETWSQKFQRALAVTFGLSEDAESVENVPSL